MTFVTPQPEQQETLAAERAEWEQLAKRLLAIGGERVVVPMWGDEHLSRYLTEGRSFDVDGLRYEPGEPIRCHQNVSYIFLDGAGAIATGFALSEDGYWRQHSWAVADDTVIETTTIRTGYFGLLLEGEEARAWAELQL